MNATMLWLWARGFHDARGRCPRLHEAAKHFGREIDDIEKVILDDIEDNDGKHLDLIVCYKMGRGTTIQSRSDFEVEAYEE